MNFDCQWKTTKISKRLQRMFKDRVSKALKQEPEHFGKQIEAIDKAFSEEEAKRKK